jgi:hypothetical protein
MTDLDPLSIVKTAMTRAEVDKLLLGQQPYQYRSRYSPAPGNTDLTELLDVIYNRLDPNTRDQAKAGLIAALNSLGGTYDGIQPIATCILYEAGHCGDRRPTLGLPLENLARVLEITIRAFENRLRTDKSGLGDRFVDGVLGNLRRMSRITQEYGGPSFCS